MQRVTSALLMSLWLAACGSAEAPSEAPPPVQETVFGDTVSTMDKARAVEDTTMQHKEALDRAVQQQEEGAANQ